MHKSSISQTRSMAGWLKNNLSNILVLSILLAGVWIRIFSYGSLFLSIGTLDTESYINSSESSTSLGSALEGRRLLSTNLLYKLIDRDQDCGSLVISSPDGGEEKQREVQPCFNTIVLVQNIISILGWALLAWTLARSVKFPPYKIIIATIIIIFGITPQIAEWDSILGAESLSVSLLPIFLAVLLLLYNNRMHEGADVSSSRESLLVVIFVITFSFWLFIRDVHLYSLPISIVLLLPFLLIKATTKRKALLALLILLSAVFVLGNYTSKLSPRWRPSLEHVLDMYIFPYPARVGIFVKLGMPAGKTDAGYNNWLSTRGLNAYSKFLITHPGFVMTSLLEKSAYFKSDFLQSHFRAPQNQSREMLLLAGEIVHPETNAVYMLDLILLSTLWFSYYRYGDLKSLGWAWLGTWLFLYAALSLFISVFGDIDGTRRHIYPSVELFRLFLWIFLIVQADRSLEKNTG
jgi:hypothetical protein